MVASRRCDSLHIGPHGTRPHGHLPRRCGWRARETANRHKHLVQAGKLETDRRHHGVPVQRTGSMDIHIMDGQGGDLGQLTDRPRHDGAPSWHPRTKAIAFESWGENDDNVDIHTMDADGSDEQRLTTHPTDDRKPSWSPDGTQILFESHRDGVMGLYIMNRDGRIVRKVTDDRLLGRPGAWLTDLHGASWFDPAVPRSVSPVGRRATTWGWLKRLGTGRPNP